MRSVVPLLVDDEVASSGLCIERRYGFFDLKALFFL